jgi:hypothetical protein
MRSDIYRDLIAQLSMLVFVLGFGVGSFLLAFVTFGPTLFGPLDRPIGGFGAAAVLFLFIVTFLLGSLIGGTAWIVVMSRWLPRETMHKWLTYGPQLKPLTALNLRLLRRAFERRDRGSN